MRVTNQGVRPPCASGRRTAVRATAARQSRSNERRPILPQGRFSRTRAASQRAPDRSTLVETVIKLDAAWRLGCENAMTRCGWTANIVTTTIAGGVARLVTRAQYKSGPTAPGFRRPLMFTAGCVDGLGGRRECLEPVSPTRTRHRENIALRAVRTTKCENRIAISRHPAGREFAFEPGAVERDRIEQRRWDSPRARSIRQIRRLDRLHIADRKWVAREGRAIRRGIER